MSKGLIVGMSGGASLNYKVIGSTSKPSGSVKENTIWIDTTIDKEEISKVSTERLELYINSSTGVVTAASSNKVYTDYFSCEAGNKYRFRLPDGQTVLIASFKEAPAKGKTGTIIYGGGKTHGAEDLDYTVTAPADATHLAIWFYDSSANDSIPTLTVNDISLEGSLPDSIEVSSHAFSATEPANPVEGMVWIKTSDSSVASFNMLKKNAAIICPVACSQHYKGAWRTKAAQIYQNGWKNISSAVTYLFNRGEINTKLTGGIYYPALSDETIHFEKNGISGGTTYTYSTKSEIDLTNHNTVKARFISGNTGESVIFRVCVLDKTANGTHFSTSQLVASASEYGPFNNIERVAELDISELSGEYYLGYAFGVRSTATAGNVKNDVSEWWLE